MENKSVDSTQFLIGAISDSLSAENRITLLSRVLKAAILARNEGASRQLFQELHGAFGLDRTYADHDSVSARPSHEVTEKARTEFCTLIMEIYPMGNLLGAGPTGYKPVLLGIRKEMLEHILNMWNGDELNESQRLIFKFLQQTLFSGIKNGLNLHIEERNMIEAVIRRRLEDSTFFGESTLRRLMNRLQDSGGDLINSGHYQSFFMMLAMARTRNGGSRSALIDISLRDENTMERPK